MAESQPRSETAAPSLPALELGDLTTSEFPHHDGQTAAAASETAIEQGQSVPSHTGTDVQQPNSTTQTQSTSADEGPSNPPPHPTIPPAAITRANTEAIGPSTELPTPMLASSSAAVSAGPVIQFTLLLANKGTRHPYQINERYLAKRNVSAVNADGKFDPSVISVYTLKELILKDWRDDWDSKPSSPSAIRLISFGQLLADNSSLQDCKINTEGQPNVLHVTVKPQEAIDEEEAAAAKGTTSNIHRGRGATERTPGCRCVIL